ncbi:unnamed protein product [Prunus armeniaca]
MTIYLKYNVHNRRYFPGTVSRRKQKFNSCGNLNILKKTRLWKLKYCLVVYAINLTSFNLLNIMPVFNFPYIGSSSLLEVGVSNKLYKLLKNTQVPHRKLNKIESPI